MAKGCSNNTYEEARKKRLEENKKKFEDLGITNISKNMTDLTNSGKKTSHFLPKLKSKSNIVAEPRRSSRVRNPVVTYRDDVGIDLQPLRKRSRSNSSSWGSYLARPLDEVKAATDEERNRAFEAAEVIQKSLQSGNSSFIKSMVRSHVYSCFWLGLPSKFCEDHLPKKLWDMVLEDENGSKYEATYIGNRSGLSGGWRAFALEHKLDDGDALVFELIEPARFKIYIVRAFPSSVEERKDVLEKNGNVSAKKASKIAAKPESQATQTRRSKRGIKHETNDSTSSHNLSLENNIDNEVKEQEKKSAKKSEICGKPRKEGKLLTACELKKDELVEEIEFVCQKPQAEKSAKKSEIYQKSRKEGKSSDACESKKDELVEDNGFVCQKPKESKSSDACESKKDEPAKDADKCISRKTRKKPAPKLFRKRA
ncbi:B3 domain-containing protein [Quillaja saponaria]|uniref:B3 domain-containing protein n=1 Tax=Quillaja saponaria TaxID=32244 RepID=A0AAD7LUB6_QUISA|nr:B3 domain-containing protein [Quillaja saponaria]